MDDIRQGIVHIIGPEQGFTLPGMTIVCGDSHTSTHGAFGALAFGIGTSEVEHVLATQTLLQKPAEEHARHGRRRRCRIGVGAKDIILAIIGKIGTAGGTGHVIEYAGDAIRAPVDGRPHDGLQHVDRGRRARRPDRARRDDLRLSQGPADGAQGRGMGAGGRLLDDAALRSRRRLRHARSRSTPREIAPQVTWGTQPGGRAADHRRRCPTRPASADERSAPPIERALDYMGLKPGTASCSEIKVDHVFIGSCTNGRIEDLRAAAAVAKGRKVAAGVRAMVVPGSGLVKEQAEEEGLDRIFLEAGFEWREPGCSMCLAMNADKLEPGERCASTSNRNFEGRQGRGGRTHLMSRRWPRPPRSPATSPTCASWCEALSER